MQLTLTIENETSLSDGGPLTYTVKGKRGFDMGRDAHLDWTLPDPSRHVSSKHCEVRYHDDGYWLHDVSTNGTFLNGSDRRMSEPCRLRDGDRIAIGHYLIRVALDGVPEEVVQGATPGAWQAQPQADFAARPASSQPAGDMWAHNDVPARPMSALAQDHDRSSPAGRALASARGGDFLDWMADLPPVAPERIPPREPSLRRDLPSAEDWSGAEVASPPDVPRSVPKPAPPAVRSEPVADASVWGEPMPSARPPVSRPPPLPPAAMMPPRVEAALALAEPASSAAAPPTPMPAASPGAMAASMPTGGMVSAAKPQPRASLSAALAAVSGTDDRAFVRAFAAGAGIPAQVLDHCSSEELAHLLGGLFRLTVDELRQLLAARFEAKRMVRSSQQTQISGVDNNPIKFTPSAEDALKLMLSAPSLTYLNAETTLRSSFSDIKTHQLETYAAMQAAVLELTDDFDPKKIDAAVGRDGALGSLVGSRKAKAWDIFLARWEAKTLRRDNGILGAFMEYFSKNYDRGK